MSPQISVLVLTAPLMRVVVLAGGSGSEHENCGSARLRNQFLYDSKGFFCMILYTSMHTRPVTFIVEYIADESRDRHKKSSCRSRS